MERRFVYYGLLLFFVLEYVRPAAHIPSLTELRLNTLVAVAVAAASVFGRGRITNRQVFDEPGMRVALALLGLIGLSVVTSDVTFYAFDRFKQVLGHLLIAWVIAKEVTDLRRLKQLFGMLVFVHFAAAVLNPQLFAEGRTAITAAPFLGDGNDFSLSVNVAIPLCLFLWFDSPKRRHRMFFAGVLLLLVAGIVATQSRGGTVALGCVGIYYWLRSQWRIRTALLAAVVVALIFMFAPAGYFERMNTINTEEGSARGRIDAWQAAGRMALDHPILGVGAGYFSGAYGTDYRVTPGRWMTAHSIYFLLLGELGFPGLTVLVLFFVVNLRLNHRLLVRLRSRDPAASASGRQLLWSLNASLVAYAIGGAFLSAAYYPHMYVLSGLLVAARRVVRESHQVAPTARQEPSRAPISRHWALQRPAPPKGILVGGGPAVR